MKKTTLVIMAAGMGSRYGGMKQFASVDSQGHILMDYAIFDATRAGFDKVICIIKPEMEKDFHEAIGKRISKYVDLTYAFQELDKLPKGYRIPEGRVKPWGTAQAVLCAKNLIDTPFSVINADDFYGRTAFESIHSFLVEDHAENEHAMVGYLVENTLTENGHVARGICETDENGHLVGIVERTHIEPRTGGAAYTEDGENFTFVPKGTIVSMNLWGFQHSILSEIENRFASYLDHNLPFNPLKCEYFLPLIPNALIQEGKSSVKVIGTSEKWYGVTYQPDMPKLQAAIVAMKEQGIYPVGLWN